MTQLSDDELGDRLTETFADHEHLADPDVAVRIATAPGRPRQRGRMLLGAAAAVALVAGGSTYALTRGSDRAPETPRPGVTHSADRQPPLPEVRTNAENRAAAQRAADHLMGRVPIYTGARTSPAIPGLHATYASFAASGHTVTRTRWWTVPRASSRGVAQWYAAHPALGLVADGRVGSAGGTDSPTVHFEAFSRPGQGETLPPVGAHVVVETTQLSTGVGVRVTVESIWPSARPVSSYVQDVSSIDVKQTQYRSVSKKLKMVVFRYSAADQPGQVMAAARAFNALVGLTPVELNCPLIRSSYTDRITFHTATGDVVAVSKTDVCSSGVTVSRDGHPVGPVLGYSAPLLKALHLAH
jgi:hypothetical protein